MLYPSPALPPFAPMDNNMRFKVTVRIFKDERWADSVEEEDQGLPPIPVEWLKASKNETDEVQENKNGWNTVNNKKRTKYRVSLRGSLYKAA